MRNRSVKLKYTIHISLLILLSGTFSLFMNSCNNSPMEGMVIAVLAENVNEGGELVAVDPDKPSKLKNISEGFVTVSSPVLSNDATQLFFAGKKEVSDKWQIWMMKLKNGETFQITNLDSDCTDPAFLPPNWVVFSKSGFINGIAVSNLFKCQVDGTKQEQITFHPHIDNAASIMQDGRILFKTAQQFPEKKTTHYRVMRPDGTKCELYYNGRNDNIPTSPGRENLNGKVYFIESDIERETGNKLMVLNQNRPLYSAKNISKGSLGEFQSVIPIDNERVLVSFRSSSNDPFAIYEMQVGEKAKLLEIYSSDKNLLNPLFVRVKERPRILPSAVNHKKTTGIIMSQDIDHSMLAPFNSSDDDKSIQVQVYGVAGLLGKVEAKSDGSVYMELDADTPVRFQTTNASGEVVRGPSAWIWLRPNERRGCVGCHADPELAPENRTPMAVKHPPVVISSIQNNL